MNSKLMMLERKLARAGSSGTPEADATSGILTSYKNEVDRESRFAIKAADDRRIKAEDECAGLIAQLSDVNKELAQTRKDLQYKIVDAEEVSEQKMESLCGKHQGEMQQMQAQIDALRGQVATERQDKVRAQTQKESAESMCAHLQQMVEKLQAVKPVVEKAKDLPRPTAFVSKVTQRDENGRVVSTITTPQYN